MPASGRWDLIRRLKGLKKGRFRQFVFDLRSGLRPHGPDAPRP